MTVKEMNALRVGDIVLRHNKNGGVSTRVVRAICRDAVYYGRAVDHHRVSISFVKQRRSQYESPCAIVYPRELLTRNYVATGHRKRLTSRIDKLIARELVAWRGHPHPHVITQDEVVGVVS